MSHTPPVDSKGAGNKRYELKKISDILDIPEASFDNFIIDLKIWVGAARATRNLVNVIAEAMGEEQPKDAVTMVWIDDGKHECEIIIKPAPRKANK